MKEEGWQGDPVDVMRMPDGGVTSLDNTRILAAREASVDVQAQIHGFNDPLPADMLDRFPNKPQTWGEAITGRINRQSGEFPNNNPNGSLNNPRVTGKP